MAYPSVMFSTTETVARNYVFERPEAVVLPIDSRIVETEIPRRDGSKIVTPVVLKSRKFEIKETLVANTPDALRVKYDNLTELLETGLLIFYLYNDRFVYCQKENFSTDYERGTGATVAHCIVSFIAADPYFYGSQSRMVTQNITATAQTLSVTTSGSTVARPLITIYTIAATNLTSLNVASVNGNFTLTSLNIGETWAVDCYNKTVTKNGTSDFADFLGNFFTIPIGTSNLTFTVNPSPCNFFVDVNYRDTYYGA